MIQSVDKALQLLTAVAKSGDWVGVRELGRLTGLNASTAHHLLKTLKDSGYLEADPETGRYRIGIAAVLMGANQDSFQRLSETVKPHLDKLFDDIGRVIVGLAVRDGSFTSNYWKQDSQGVIFAQPPGRAVPKPHMMACGCILMPWQPESWLDAYMKENKLPDSFKRILLSLRDKDSYVTPDSDGFGQHAIGVRVMGLGEAPVMSIGWSLPGAIATEREIKHVHDRMVSTASAISAVLRLEH